MSRDFWLGVAIGQDHRGSGPVISHGHVYATARGSVRFRPIADIRHVTVERQLSAQKQTFNHSRHIYYAISSPISVLTARITTLKNVPMTISTPVLPWS